LASQANSSQAKYTEERNKIFRKNGPTWVILTFYFYNVVDIERFVGILADVSYQNSTADTDLCHEKQFA
jgi:hypothetical protein